jgi:hypothetical protein
MSPKVTTTVDQRNLAHCVLPVSGYSSALETSDGESREAEPGFPDNIRTMEYIHCPDRIEGKSSKVMTEYDVFICTECRHSTDRDRPMNAGAPVVKL